MKLTAWIFLALFYGCYFGKMLSQRRKGIVTDQMGVGKTGTVLAIELCLKVTTILTALCQAASVIWGGEVLPLPVRIAGALLLAAGTAFFWLSVLTMKDSWRAGVPQEDETEFITRGVFGISRNPAFLGFDLTYVGIALMFFSWWFLSLTVASCLLFHLQITLVEEPFLRERFGKDYEVYSEKVCRYLGKR